MKNLLLICVLVLFASTTMAADPAQPKMDAKMQEMMTKMKEYATPGPAHKILADMAGNWTYTSKFWESADGKPQESNGKSSMKMILGGRYLQQDISGQAMGAPFQGMGLFGYNNVTKKYETMWLDTMGTGAMHGEGSFDTASKTLKDSGSYSCPLTGKDRTYRGEWKIVDKNNMVYAMYGQNMEGTGPEFKNMEMTFKRTK